jgi:hypothetical protein
MFGNADLGPMFGYWELRLGLTLGHDAGDDSRSWRYGVYECPAGQDGETFLTGVGTFRSSEVEVHRVHYA